MRILPVLDLKGGLVVRGIAGRRQEYQPVRSCLTPSACPLDVALAFRQHFGLHELYVADLDAIAGQPPALAIFASLQAHGFHLWVDAGLHKAADAKPLADAGIATLVAGLETLAGPDELTSICQCYGWEKIVFSLDLRDGQALRRTVAWGCHDPAQLAELAVTCGTRRLLILDLARVGVPLGPSTAELCGWLRQRHPQVELTTGGGIRGLDDLRHLQRCGVQLVLVASALHDGLLQHHDLEILYERGK